MVSSVRSVLTYKDQS